MPNSLRTKLSKLRYKRQISDEEYRELTAKLNGHDKELLAKIRAEIMDFEEELFHRPNTDYADYAAVRHCVEIIDKYTEEGSDEDADSN